MNSGTQDREDQEFVHYGNKVEGNQIRTDDISSVLMTRYS